MSSKQAKAHHSVYVIELDEKICNKKRFKQQNPGYQPGQACLYVGMTGRNPETRFQQHLAGYKASRSVKNFGVRLRHELFARLNPMPYDQACKKEVSLAETLRDMGYGVIQA